jgi:hypothetical protein
MLDLRVKVALAVVRPIRLAVILEVCWRRSLEIAGVRT